jgi:uncharacterized repeat protein (TIGR01451 family)
MLERDTRALLCAWVMGLALSCATPAFSDAATAPGTPIDNTASGSALEPVSGAILNAQSNTVTAIVQAAQLPPPTLAFFTGPDFARTTRLTALGAPLYVQATAPQCDLDSNAAETLSVRISSSRTRDTQRYDLIETGAHTGVFRIAQGAPVSDVANASSVSTPNALRQARNDHLSAVLQGCGALATIADVWVQPSGTVFDAASGAPIAGARVQLIDVTGDGNGGLPGAPALVHDFDGVTPAPAEFITGSDGAYVFPALAPSQYRLVVMAPEPWRFPSRVPWTELTAGRVLDVQGSFGSSFAMLTSGAPVALDIPLDAELPVALFAEKSASRTFVELGDALDYTVRIANRSDSTLAAPRVQDQLPAGFAYVPGSARRDDGGIADPTGGRGPALTFALGAMPPRSTTTLTYRVVVGPDARRGDAINAAVAISGPVRSNTATAKVRVQSDAFADEGMVMGVVKLTGMTPTPLAGVKLVLDDGTWAITDVDGRYSFAGITPRTHALKLDVATLPVTAHALVSDHRNEGDPSLRFVDLTRGDLVRADFMVQGDSLALRDAGERRLALLPRDERARVIARGVDALGGPRAVGDTRSLPASRSWSGEGEGAAAPRPAADAPSSVRAGLATAPAAAAPGIDALLPGLDTDLGFVGLEDLDTLTTTQCAVVVKGPLGSTLALRVNGKLIPETRVGRRFTAARSGVEAWEYIGVDLAAGVNVLEVAPPHSVGRVAVRVIAPGPLARVEIAAPRRVVADGRSEAALDVWTRDAAGVPVGARTIVTLDASAGRVACDDLDPTQSGVQLAIEGGHRRIALLSPTAPATIKLTLSCGVLRASTSLDAVPDLKPLFAVGSAEGVIALNHWRRSSGVGDLPTTGFEAPIEQFATANRDGALSAAAHGAFYVKGRVRNDVQLTLGYDSDKPSDQRLFRDQQLDRGYPVAGDASDRGYDAQSTQRLFARLDRPDGSLLYGDYTLTSSGARALGAYGRSLSGVVGDWHDHGAQVQVFTSRDRSRRAIDEIAGRGISGPYVLTHAPMLENSERVEVLVRDRRQPSLILTTSAQQRFVDYELEPLTGRLLFRRPLPSLDADLNPVSVRVTYEVQDGGAAAWVHGADARVQVGPKLLLGGALVDDHDPTSPYELRSLSASAKLAAHTTLTGEWASSRHLQGASGGAERFELLHQAGTIEARLYGVSTATGFDNPSAGFGAGRREAGGRLVARLADRTRLTAEALFTGDAPGHERRGGLLLALDRALSDAWRGEAGVRVSGGTSPTTVREAASVTMRLKLTGQVPSHPEWSGYGETEQDTRDWDRRLAAIGGEYRFRSHGRLYARHEFLSSLSSPWTLSAAQKQLSTVMGIDADVAGDAHVFSEYRVSDAVTNRQSQAAVGLRNAWRLDDGMRIGASFERVSPLAGDPQGASTAITGSVDWSEDPHWKGSSRMELRTSRASDQFVQSMAAAVKLDSSWTALGRHLLTVTDAPGQGGDARERLQLAFAFRDARGLDALARWELHYDRGAAPARARRVANIVGFNTSATLAHGLAPSLAWAARLTREEGGSGVTAGGAQWLHGRLTRDLARGWDCGLTGSVLIGRTFAQRQSGIGAELGRRLPNGAWASLGFNRFGYTDDDLTGEEWTRAGAYLRLRVKFDESFVRRAVGVAE